jgi:Carboxypeptidase regulatory-like domain
MDQFLTYLVTLLGVVLCILSFAVIFRGQRVPGDEGNPQELEFKGLKVKTNVVVSLLLVSVVVAVLPLALQAWPRIVEARSRSCPDPLATPAKPQDLALFLTGQVLDSQGPVEGASVTVVNLKDSKPGDPQQPVAKVVTDGSGSFDFAPLPLGDRDRYKVVAAKDGYIEQYVYMGPGGAVTVRSVLVAKKKGGGNQ